MSRLVLLLLLVPMALAVPVALLHYIWAVFTAPATALRIAIGFDQLANVALNGDPDETISSRAASARDKNRRWACVLCRVLDWLETDHCNKSRGI